jgi:DNA-binding IclR family transcriptional regulator
VEARAARRARVLGALEDDPGLTLAELEARTGVPLRVLFAVLHRLQEAGEVCHEANRWYPVPE